MNSPSDHTQQGSCDGQRQSKQHRHPETVEQPRKQIAASVIGAKDVVFGWRRGVGFFGEVIQRAVVVGVGWVNRPIARLGKLLANKGVKKVGRGLKVTAELGFWRVVPNREIQLALITGHQGFVVADQLGRQTCHKQQHKQNQADKAQAVALEALPSNG